MGNEKAVSLAVVGIGGYGASYLDELLGHRPRAAFELLGVVDPAAERSRHFNLLVDRGVRVYPQLELLYREHRPDLAIIVSPIHHHATQTCLALSHGSSVLCEKPLAATIDEARAMLQASRRSPGFAAIGYQWSFSKAIQTLKLDIIAGKLGRPLRMKTLVSYPRGWKYYHRNDWAGRLYTAGGSAVFDSPLNNATSHFLHNMLYLLGPRQDLSARPVVLQAELYRANDIESFDTAALRCRTDHDVELLFYTTHAAAMAIGPVVHYQFERAEVYFEPAGVGFVARFRDGRVCRYGDPGQDRHQNIWQSIEAVADSGRSVVCGIPAASAQTLCVAAAHESCPKISSFPAKMVGLTELPDGDRMYVARGLFDALVQCYDQEILPAEHGGLDWASPAARIELLGPRWSFDSCGWVAETANHRNGAKPSNPVSNRRVAMPQAIH